MPNPPHPTDLLFVPCPLCDGHGVWDPSLPIYRQQDCPHCSGEGKLAISHVLTCFECMATGAMWESVQDAVAADAVAATGGPLCYGPVEYIGRPPAPPTAPQQDAPRSGAGFLRLFGAMELPIGPLSLPPEPVPASVRGAGEGSGVILSPRPAGEAA